MLKCDSRHQGNCVTYTHNNDNYYIDGTTQNEENYECYAVAMIQDRAHPGWYMATCQDDNDDDDPCACIPWAKSPHPEYAQRAGVQVGCADPTGSGEGDAMGVVSVPCG